MALGKEVVAKAQEDNRLRARLLDRCVTPEACPSHDAARQRCLNPQSATQNEGQGHDHRQCPHLLSAHWPKDRRATGAPHEKEESDESEDRDDAARPQP